MISDIGTPKDFYFKAQGNALDSGLRTPKGIGRESLRTMEVPS